MSMGSIDLGRVGIWTGILDTVPSSQAVEFALEAEELGYGAIWYPEAVGRDPFVMATLLLQGTSSIKVASGIANIYARDAMTMANVQRTIEEAFPGPVPAGRRSQQPSLGARPPQARLLPSAQLHARVPGPDARGTVLRSRPPRTT